MYFESPPHPPRGKFARWHGLAAWFSPVPRSLPLWARNGLDWYCELGFHAGGWVVTSLKTLPTLNAENNSVSMQAAA